MRLHAPLAGALALAACVPVPEARPPAPAPVAMQPVSMPFPPAEIDRASVAQGDLLLGRAPAGTVRLLWSIGDAAPLAVPVASDRRFVIGIDRDAPPGSASGRLTASRGDGSESVRPVAVTARAWRLERLNSLSKVPVPSAAFAARRPGELARIAAARAQETGADGWRQAFAWPVTGRISGLFGSQRIYRGEPGAYHSGVDVARPAGTPVAAPADGVVTLAADAPFTLEGRLLVIDHGMGLNSAFLHLSRIDVRAGERVRRGQPVGAIGATGRATGPHLHWSMTWRGARLDPLLAAGPMPQGSSPSRTGDGGGD